MNFLSWNTTYILKNVWKISVISQWLLSYAISIENYEMNK